MVMGWDVDGVIAISFSKSNCEKIYQLINKPIVSIDAYGELDAGQENHVLNIGLDDESGGYLMTKYLLECGYEHIQVCAQAVTMVWIISVTWVPSVRQKNLREKTEGAVYRSWNELRQTKRKLCVADPAEKTEDCAVFPVRPLCTGGDQLFQQPWSKDPGGNRNRGIR